MTEQQFTQDFLNYCNVFTPEYSPSNIPGNDQLDDRESPLGLYLYDERSVAQVHGAEQNIDTDSLKDTYAFLLLSGQDLLKPENVRSARVTSEYMDGDQYTDRRIFYPGTDDLWSREAAEFVSYSKDSPPLNPVKNPAVSHAVDGSEQPFPHEVSIGRNDILKRSYMKIPENFPWENYSFLGENVQSYLDGERSYDALTHAEKAKANADVLHDYSGTRWKIEKTVREML